MTKRELEIRLEVAERVIAECIYGLGEENIKTIMQENGWDHEGGVYGSIGYTKFSLNHYTERANEAVERNGKDIYHRKI